MHWTQMAVTAALMVYIGAFVAIMVVVRRSVSVHPRGHARGHSLAALFNGLASLLLLVTAIAYPLQARSVDWFGRIGPLDHPLARGVGVVSLTLAGICLIWGEVSLGRSFRVALPERVQPLVTRGIYGFTRNPLALSVDLLALGVLLLAPSWLALISLIANVIAYEVKIRIEEAYLHQAHGAAYVAYCQRTGRYLPKPLHRYLEDTSTRQRLTELESLHRMTTALLQTLTLEQVLQVVCQEARQLTGATGCALYSLQEDAWLHLAHSGGTLAPPTQRMPLEGTLAGRAVTSGQPVLINDAEGLRQTSHPIPDLESLLIIPLRLRETIVGALDVANKPEGFTEHDMRLLGIFADGAAIAIESARLQQQAEQLAIVEERQRLARELHDSVTQGLYSVTLYAEATRMALAAGRQDVATANLEELHHMAREAMVDMRMLIFELHPPMLEEEGLVAALQARLAAVESRAGLQAEFCVEGEQLLPLSVQEELFWIAVEAFNNVIKHAKAQQVEVCLRLDRPTVCLSIKDDGIGFDPATAGQRGGMGLCSMAERVERIRGKLEITSAPGSGTTVSVQAEF